MRVFSSLQLPCCADEMVEATNGAFERALVLLHKMPRIWIMWLEFVVKQKRVTSTRCVRVCRWWRSDVTVVRDVGGMATCAVWVS
jgi:hypothetical protein